MIKCPTDTVACAMKPEHLGGCSQSVQYGVAPDCSGFTFCCSLGYDACCIDELSASDDSIGKLERVCGFCDETRTLWGLLSKCALWGCSRLLGGNTVTACFAITDFY